MRGLEGEAGSTTRTSSSDILQAYAPHPYQSLDANGDILAVNDAWLSVMGYQRGDVIGRWFGEFLEGDSADAFESEYNQFKSTGTISNVVLDLVDADGETITVAYDGMMEYDADGSVVCSHCQFKDITNRIRYEEELAEHRNNLEILNQVLRHDIRNDLQIVMGHVELLTEDRDERREAVARIQEKARHMIELTSTAHDMAVLWSSEGGEFSQIPLQEVLETEVEKLQLEYPDASITVDADIPEVAVFADEMLGSVLHNLLHNAIQHNDSERPEVVVSANEGPERVQVTVADNGPGVPDARKESIFGKGNKGLESSGTGLGLHLVQTLVDGYGGYVWVEDNDPEGAKVIVEFQKTPTGE